MPYRSNMFAIEAALEEQRQLRTWAKGSVTRKRRVLSVLAAFPVLAVLISVSTSRPVLPRLHCHVVEVQREPYGGMAPPPDTWTSCALD
jgi:hypothetical protein